MGRAVQPIVVHRDLVDRAVGSVKQRSEIVEIGALVPAPMRAVAKGAILSMVGVQIVEAAQSVRRQTTDDGWSG